MKKFVCAVRDLKLADYGDPMFFRTLGEAERAFRDGVSDPQSMLNKHPEDYDLWHIGMYDSETGAFFAEGGPLFLCNALSMIRKDS